jgi:hypothetical protein
MLTMGGGPSVSGYGGRACRKGAMLNDPPLYDACLIGLPTVGLSGAIFSGYGRGVLGGNGGA